MANDEDKMAKPKVGEIDPFFHLEPGGDFNACIGRQGSEENYIDGYMDAAQELASAVVDKRLFGKRDTLAMPILYNARHAVELTMKFAIEHLHKLGRLPESHRANHDIEGQWGMLATGNLGDARLRDVVGRLEPFVASLAAIDEDGQELRYAVNRHGKKSMEAYTLVDLELVKANLDALAELLSMLKYRVEDLYEERASGTWTDECSRSDLIAIAKELPPRGDWRTEAFEVAKNRVMERYGLTGRKFSAAIKKIEASREGQRLLGVETPLTHLTDEHALLVVELWSERHPPRDDEGGDGAFFVYPRDRDWEEIRGRRKLAGELNARLIEELHPDEIADVEAIFYMGREGWMPEFYDRTLERTKVEHSRERDLTMKLNHLMEKLNLADELRKGVHRLGRPSLAEKIAGIVDARSANAAHLRKSRGFHS